MNEKHSKEFIEEMKGKLLAEKSQITGEMPELMDEQGNGTQSTFPDYGRSEEENATEVADALAFKATATANEARLKEIEAALDCIEQGTYGVTDNGEIIPEARLRANPAATKLIK